MKLATLRDGTRDGRLVVVRRDLSTCVPAGPSFPTLQSALDDWTRIKETRSRKQDAERPVGHNNFYVGGWSSAMMMFVA